MSGEGGNRAGYEIHVRHGQKPAMGLPPDGTICSVTVCGVTGSSAPGKVTHPAWLWLCHLLSGALGKPGEKVARFNPPLDCRNNYKMQMLAARLCDGRLGRAVECCSLLSCSGTDRRASPPWIGGRFAQALQGGHCWSSGVLQQLVKVTTKALS